MNTALQATDWQVSCVAQAVGAVGAAGGWFLFNFYSKALLGGSWMLFSGIGLGEGGHLSGSVNPDDYGAFSSPWATMSNIPYCCGYQSFGIDNLKGCGGRVASMGVSVEVVGYSATYITAGENFFSQNVGGLGFGPAAAGGVGAGAFELLGGWSFLKDSFIVP